MNTNTMNTNMNKPQYKTGRQNLMAVIAIALTTLCCSSLYAWNPEIPGAPQKGPIAIVGAKIYTVAGPVIESGTVLFENGKITAVAEQVDLLRLFLHGRRGELGRGGLAALRGGGGVPDEA